jgi:hypothetical protein
MPAIAAQHAPQLILCDCCVRCPRPCHPCVEKQSMGNTIACRFLTHVRECKFSMLHIRILAKIHIFANNEGGWNNDEDGLERVAKRGSDGGALAVWVASNCESTPNGRTAYVSELMRWMSIDSYGRCRATPSCPNASVSFALPSAELHAVKLSTKKYI